MNEIKFLKGNNDNLPNKENRINDNFYYVIDDKKIYLNDMVLQDANTLKSEIILDSTNLIIYEAELNDLGILISTTATYDDVYNHFINKKELLLKTTWLNEIMYMRLTEWKNDVNPYFSFNGTVINGMKVFSYYIHVKKDENTTYSEIKEYQMVNEKVSTWSETPNDDNYPSEKLCFDSFIRKPEIVYQDVIGFEANGYDAGKSYQLTDLDLSKYKRLKLYVKSGGDGNTNYSPMHIVEMSLDDSIKGTFGYFAASHVGHNPNNRNRLHISSFIVNAEKTSIQFQHSISLYGTAGSDSVGGRYCFLIEGYFD